MAVHPHHRKTILCDAWHYDPPGSNRVVAEGILSTITALEVGDASAPYPLLHRGFSALVFLSGGRGSGQGFVDVIWEETGEQVHPPLGGTIPFGLDPLEVSCIAFNLRDVVFDRPGRYVVRFVFDGEVISEDSLLLR